MQKIGFLILPVLFFIYNATETYLKLNHSSVCESKGCKLADMLLKYDSIYLNYAGTIGAFLIMTAGFIAYRRGSFRKYFYFLVFIALLFETIMLSYQYYASPQMCKFCMGVYAFLLLILLFSARRYFFVAIPAVLALLVAVSSLKIANSAPKVVADGTYLIQSPTCPHCKKVKKYLKDHDIPFKKIDVKDISAQNFITFLGYHTIPMLVVKKRSTVNIVNGDEDIINFYESKSKKESSDEQSDENKQIDNSAGQSVDLFGNIGNDDGCGFLPIDKTESSCEDNESK